jgi:hypothetical protein
MMVKHLVGTTLITEQWKECLVLLKVALGLFLI